MKSTKTLVVVGLFFLAFIKGMNAGEINRVTAENIHLVPNGRSLDAIYGDWMLRNDRVVVVIGDAIPGREANMRAQSIQGAVIDFTSLRDDNDYLVAFYPQGYPTGDSRSNPLNFADEITILKAKGNEVILQVTRNQTTKTPYVSITEYALRDGEDFLRMTTTYINKTAKAVKINVADKIRLDQDIIDTSPVGHHNLAFIYNKWFHSAYGVYSPTGLTISEEPTTGHVPEVGISIVIDSDSKWNTTLDTLTLDPSQMFKKERYLFYGKDVAEIQRSITENGLDEETHSNATFKITDSNNMPLNDLFLEVFDAQNELVSFAITNEEGEAKIPLLNFEDYKFRGAKVGHDAISSSFSISDKAKLIQATFEPLTSIEFDIKESKTNRRLPIKLEFKGINGTADPFLGTTKRAEGANNFYYAINKNSFTVPIAPGNYMVTISRGPEYATVQKEVKLSTGESKKVESEINRVFDSPNWIIADFHNHTAISGDNDSETLSRVVNFVGAGLEFAPATEHNRISSYTNIIKKLGLEEFIVSAAGIELTGPPGKSPNHENAFPLKIKNGSQGGGFPGIHPDPFIQLKGLYDYDSENLKFIQHNHPEIPQLYFDKNKDGILDDGYGTRQFTDAIELQDSMFDILKATSENAKSEDKKSRVFYWLQMLNQGDRIFGTTTSDNHRVGPASGARFVYVHTINDSPKTIDATEIASNAKKGHILMSSGPFLKTDINGFLPGDEIKKEGSLKIYIEVFGNNENNIDEIQLLVNGKQDSNYNFKATTHPDLFSQESLKFKHSFSLELDEDAIVIVVATGKSPLLNIDNEGEEHRPIVISNPFFIDIDNDGFVANKDTLGEPLPVVKEPAD